MTPEASPKKCRECRWFKSDGTRYEILNWCEKNTQPGRFNAIGDYIEGGIGTAWSARASDGVCGPDGRLWEPRVPWWRRILSSGGRACS